MRRWPLVALAALALSAPAAGAAPRPCWQRVIDDWYQDGKIDSDWSCACVREAIAHLPEDGSAPYASVGDVLRRAEENACAAAASPVERVTEAKPHRKHVNWPARITGAVLLFVAFGLLIWRRRQRATSRDDRRAPDRE